MKRPPAAASTKGRSVKKSPNEEADEGEREEKDLGESQWPDGEINACLLTHKTLEQLYDLIYFVLINSIGHSASAG